MNIFKTWKNKNPQPKTDFKNNNKINNFYGKETIKEQTKRFHLIHYIIKYKLIVPGIILTKKILGKKLATKIPDEPQYTWIQRWNDSFDKATLQWNYIYLNSLRKKKQSIKQCKKNYEEQNTGSLALIRTSKEIINTLCINDDSYAELIPYIMIENYYTIHNIIKENKIHHLMHSVPKEMNQLDEMIYLKLQRKIKEGKVNFEMEIAGKQKNKK